MSKMKRCEVSKCAQLARIACLRACVRGPTVGNSKVSASAAQTDAVAELRVRLASVVARACSNIFKAFGRKRKQRPALSEGGAHAFAFCTEINKSDPDRLVSMAAWPEVKTVLASRIMVLQQTYGLTPELSKVGPSSDTVSTSGFGLLL